MVFPAEADSETKANLLGTNVLIDFTWSQPPLPPSLPSPRPSPSLLPTPGLGQTASLDAAR